MLSTCTCICTCICPLPLQNHVLPFSVPLCAAGADLYELHLKVLLPQASSWVGQRGFSVGVGKTEGKWTQDIYSLSSLPAGSPWTDHVHNKGMSVFSLSHGYSLWV